MTTCRPKPRTLDALSRDERRALFLYEAALVAAPDEPLPNVLRFVAAVMEIKR